MMNIFLRIFDRSYGRDEWRQLYAACVKEARNPIWYVNGEVEDSLNSRFEMLALIVSLLFIKLEKQGEAGDAAQLMLTELLVEDVDAQFREDGMGDAGLGKHMGTMMSGFGGRLDAYRHGLTNDALAPALERNLYRGDTPPETAMAFSIARTKKVAEALGALTLEALRKGDWPA